jgi:hypothetical protein
MPTVLRWDRIAPSSIPTKEANRRMSMSEVAIWKPSSGCTMSVTVNAGFQSHEIGGIIRHLRSHRDELLGAWHEHFGN